MGLAGQEYWSGLPFPSPGDLPDPIASKQFIPSYQAPEIHQSPGSSPVFVAQKNWPSQRATLGWPGTVATWRRLFETTSDLLHKMLFEALKEASPMAQQVKESSCNAGGTGNTG